MSLFKPLKAKSAKDNGTYVFGNFDIGLYNLDTPRLIGEQLSSLALTGGRNVWTERGALVPQHGYLTLAELPEGEYIAAVSKDSYSASTFFIVTQSANVYLYTAAQGLKKYATGLGTVTNPIIVHSGKHLAIYNEGAFYLFGAYYAEGEQETILSDVALSDYSSYYQFTVSEEDIQYFWNGKDLEIDGQYHFIITSITPVADSTNYIVKAIKEGEHVIFNNTVTIGERTLIERDLVYTPEDSNLDPILITPELMEVCINRLFVVDVTGRIYYSQVGGIDVMANTPDPENVTGWLEAYGAGYFEGFYGDTSKTLSIEDFMDGALIAKEDGLYTLTLSAPSYSYASTGSDNQGLLSVGTMEVSIKKIANIGQQYAGDHVIVREEVYAYDTYSGSFVNAASTNVFGALVAGPVIMNQKALNSINSGIASTKRFLVYNGQENIFTLYYGTNLNYGVVFKLNATIFPRQLDTNVSHFISFNQGVVAITEDSKILQEFKEGTIIEHLPAVAEFEAIGLRDNRLICSSLLEVTELNGVDYEVTTRNAGIATQYIHPVINQAVDGSLLPPLVYSDYNMNMQSNSFELTTRWADKKSTVTRLYAPMSGREGVQISLTFPEACSFCLAALRLPDFSQGE